MTAPTLVRVAWKTLSRKCFDPRLNGDTLSDLVFIMDPDVRTALDAFGEQSADEYAKLAEWALNEMTSASACGGYEDSQRDDARDSSPTTGPVLNQIVFENFDSGDVFCLAVSLRGDELTCVRVAD